MNNVDYYDNEADHDSDDDNADMAMMLIMVMTMLVIPAIAQPLAGPGVTFVRQ